MCSCYAEEFHKQGSSYVKKQKKWKNGHEYFVFACSGHPHIHRLLTDMQTKCKFKDLGLFETCEFCIQVKYLINFRAYEFCVKSIPEKSA